MSIPTGITRTDVLAALARLDAGESHPFGPPTKFILRHEDGEYPPKAAVGLAARRVLGRDLKPAEFSSGVAPGQAVHVLRGLGFVVEELGVTAPSPSTSVTRSEGFWLVAYFLSKFSEPLTPKRAAPPRELGVKHWKHAYQGFYERLGEGRTATQLHNSLKNARDSFDAHASTLRRGWQASLPSPAQAILDAHGDRSRQAIWKDVEPLFNPLAEAPAPGFTESDLQPTEDHHELAARTTRLRGRKRTGKPSGNKHPKSGTSTTTTYVRDPDVQAYVLDESGGVCERCEAPAPFLKPNGDPYLEVHHVRQLAHGGSDTIHNAVALCPNCHREAHSGPHPTNFQKSMIQQVARLKSEA